ncbi:hypothetical protein H2200_010282 [Cladophialophora chaetospira]|uniref:Uncharacterized protein n=1 Tax=Cladophialophora chaetospira TaxID=386627 RepID=A0AA38X155_9EURO|nr:hypothetical protein H2200_010282 [Cladophialophora chaetospira]
MTTPPHKGVALCYDQQNWDLYNNACFAVNEIGNSDEWVNKPPSPRFACKGYLIANWVQALRDGGENGCVCKFNNVGGSWVFGGHWGACNGACVSPTFSCDGGTPVPGNGVGSKEKRAAEDAEVEKRASVAVPTVVPWRTAVFALTIVFCNLVL